MFCQNDQIHHNLYLTVENSIEIGKGYQVIEKWVFFKLLFQILQTDSSGGKNHINHPSYLLDYSTGSCEKSNTK
jgi:hypothetical protein